MTPVPSPAGRAHALLIIIQRLFALLPLANSDSCGHSAAFLQAKCNHEEPTCFFLP